jgi:pimeloyl-ACP methyl ester carboxylesterase
MSSEFVIDIDGGVLSGRRTDPAVPARLPGGPLIVALHGGSYSSLYFDIPGYSLMERAAAAGCPVAALDRPGYRKSTLLTGDEVLMGNAERLDAGIAELWRRNGADGSGVVLVGHSIGGAVSVMIAARRPSWPLLGVAGSGFGLSLPAHGRVFEPNPTAGPYFEVPSDAKNAAMFGPPGTYADDAQTKASAANELVVIGEIMEINKWWPRHSLDSCSRVQVPVQYRLGEYDHVPPQGAEEMEKIRRAFSNAPSADVETIREAGHCIDFHKVGAAFQDGQIAFAIECARRKVARGANE